jgi:hypothetical protein
MTTNFLYAQAPNRKGNVSKRVPGMGGPLGATAVTGPSHGVATPKGSQGAPKASGNVYPVGNKVSVSTPKFYDKTPRNDAYMNSDRNNYLK